MHGNPYIVYMLQAFLAQNTAKSIKLQPIDCHAQVVYGVSGRSDIMTSRKELL